MRQHRVITGALVQAGEKVGSKARLTAAVQNAGRIARVRACEGGCFWCRLAGTSSDPCRCVCHGLGATTALVEDALRFATVRPANSPT